MILVQEKEKQTRENIQSKAVEFSKLYHYIILQYPTGLGKSFTMIQIFDLLYQQNKKISCLILMPEIALIDNLRKEFLKFGREYLLANTEIICYASLHKVDKEYDIIIADEMHHTFSDIRKENLSNFNPKYFIGLSATVDDWKIRQLEGIFRREFFVHRVTLSDAIKWGILPAPKIGAFVLKLNDKDINCSYEFVRGKKENRVEIICEKESDKWRYIKDKKNYPNLKLIVKCTQRQKYNFLENQSDYYRDKYSESIEILENKHKLDSNIEVKDDYKKHKWLYSELCIKRFLSEIKTPYLNEFLKDLNGLRYIVFLGSVNQAIELAKNNNGNAISSKEKESLQIIERFLNKEIDNLYCVNMLQEGANLTDIEVAVLGQLDSSKRAFIQKIGRSLRSRYPEIYIFYFEGTKDEEYLNKSISHIGKEYIQYLDYFYVV